MFWCGGKADRDELEAQIRDIGVIKLRQKQSFPDAQGILSVPIIEKASQAIKRQQLAGKRTVVQTIRSRHIGLCKRLCRQM
jgi:hypothetical protein